MDKTEIEKKLKAFPRWKYDGLDLKTEIEFEKYLDSIQFVNLVAEIAEELNHHPEINIKYGIVVIKIHTHDTNSITHLDFSFLEKVDNLIL
jgi:4a-hydroxytetrahydrobiopterin dehydratase